MVVAVEVVTGLVGVVAAKLAVVVVVKLLQLY